jgi:hypothetical protein
MQENPNEPREKTTHVEAAALQYREIFAYDRHATLVEVLKRTFWYLGEKKGMHAGEFSAHLLYGHRHHVAGEIGDDPNRASDDEKHDQYAECEGQNIVRAVGAAAQMQEEH